MNVRWLILAVVVVLSTGTAYAVTCTGSMTTSYDPAANTLLVTVTLGNSECSAPSVSVSVEGYNFSRSDHCPTLSGCTLTFFYTSQDLMCLAPGPHTVSAGFGCKYTMLTYYCYSGTPSYATSSFAVPDITPTISVSTEQPTPSSLRVHMPYEFRNALGTRGLKLVHYLPDGTGDGFDYSRTGDPVTGEWIKDFADISCWLPGDHRFVATATACGRFQGVAETTYTVPDETPSISANVVVPAPNTARVDMTFGFSPRQANHANHALNLAHTRPDGTGDGLIWIYTTDQQSGTWSQSFDTTCWQSGTHTFTANASVCNRTNSTATTTLEIVRKPHVDVSLQKNGATKTALINYQFADNEPNGRSLIVEYLPVFPANTRTELRNITPVNTASGTEQIDVSAFGVSGILRARASNSCGEVDSADTYIDCDCHPNEGPNTAPRPVRLWDGSMTYSERDPMPAEGFGVFTRNYDTLYTNDGVFGTGWRSAFNAGLAHLMTGSLDTVTIQTEGERKAAFIRKNGVWTQSWPSVSPAATLTQVGDGTWQYREGGSTLVRIFRADGRLAGFDDRSSTTKVLIDYDASGLPQRIYSDDGTWSCTVTVTGNHITAISVDGRPDLTWQYNYAGSLLQSVTLNGTSAAWRTYEYDGGRLSAVRDAAANLIESHTFDSLGRAIDSIGIGPTDITNIEYDLPGSLADSTITRVTYATGDQTTFEQRFIHGRQQTIATVGGCGSCGSRNATWAVDAASGLVARSQDARGYVSSFAYDSTGQLIQERRNDRPASCDPDQDPSHCRMSPASLLTASLQSTAASTFVNYAYGDAQWPDRATSVTTPSVAKPGDTRVDTVTYDFTTGMPLARMSTGWTTGAASESRTTTVTLYDGAATAAFNPARNFAPAWLTLPQPAGKRKKIDGPRTDINSDGTTFVYYPIDNSVPATYRGRLAATQNAAGHITTFENYDVFGNAARIVDSNGVATESTYDALGRVVTTTLKGVSGCDTVADPLCASDLTTTLVYTPSTGPLASQTDANGNARTFEYDARGRQTAMSRGASATSLKERLEYTYDPATGRKSSERYLGLENASWAEKHRESFTYDSLAQLIAQTHADTTSVAYTYDDAGSLTSVRDENHSAANTHYAYDPARGLTSVQQTLGAGNITTSYAYDVAGNLSSVTDPNGNVTTYAYDDFGEMTAQTSPVTGTTTYAYGKSGTLLTTADANGATTTRSYDALDRVTSAVSTRSGQTDTISWTYDSGSLGLGRMTSMTDPVGSTAYTYDRRGLLLSETRTSGSVLLATSFKYDANGNRTGITYPSGASITHAFDYANRPLTLNAWGSLFIAGTKYLPFGPESEVTYGNGLIHTRTYDSRYRIQRNTLTGNPGMIADYSYTEDAVGNITSIHDLVDDTWNRDFAYDDLNRLVTANSGSSLWGPGSYRYDAMGNLLARDLGGMKEVDPNDPLVRTHPFSMRSESLPVPGSVHETYVYLGTTPKLATITWDSIDHTMTYDAAGNETRYLATRTYSPRNLMSSIAEDSEDDRPHTVSYGYDGRGVRVVRSEGTTGTGTPFASRYYVYSPELNLLAMSVDDNPNIWGKHGISNVVPAMKSEFLWYNGRPVGQLDGQTIRYTFTDHLGTPILQTDTNSSVIWRAEYEPYGDTYLLRAGTTAAEQPLRFPGQEYERKWEGAEERYNIFRWYRAGWGRYTQADPLYMKSETSLYAYVDGNPTRWKDRQGLDGDGPSWDYQDGPWHPDRPVSCSKADDCPTLKTKIGLISRTIASHRHWDAVNLAMGGTGDRHVDEIKDWVNAINKCRDIYEEKCRNTHDNCKPCKFVKEMGPVMLGGYIIYKTVELFFCPPLVPITP
jgi:RHS repeat-associated protein